MTQNTPENKSNKTIEASTDERVSISAIEDARLASKETKSLSQGQLVLRRFLRHKPAMISAVVLAFIIIVSITSIGISAFGITIPGWWRFDYVEQGDIIDGGAPSATHWFGQDALGVDYFALVMRGTQVSLIIAVLVGVVSTALGTLLGAISGYFRGFIDGLIMRIADIFFVVPLLLIAAIVGRIAGSAVNSPWFLGLLLGCVSWAGLSRLVRSQVLSLREREFIDAARAMGASTNRIVMKHLIPNTVGTILVNATLAIAAAVLLETSLSYLGYGVRPPQSSLGLLISTYQNSFTTRPWLFWWPGLMILTIALTINFIGDGLRDAFDPRQGAGRRKRSLWSFIFPGSAHRRGAWETETATAGTTKTEKDTAEEVSEVPIAHEPDQGTPTLDDVKPDTPEGDKK